MPTLSVVTALVAFHVSAEHGCSQSWEVTTWSGSLRLSETPDGQRLSAEGMIHNVFGSQPQKGEGGSWEAPSRTERPFHCSWEGREGLFTLGQGDHGCEGGFTLQCGEPPASAAGSPLTCTLSPGRPRLLDLLAGEGGLVFDPTMQIIVQDYGMGMVDRKVVPLPASGAPPAR